MAQKEEPGLSPELAVHETARGHEPLRASAAGELAPPLRSVESLFRRCNESRNPALALSRACSKVGYLARFDQNSKASGARSHLHYLESGLNEHKHMLLMQRLGNTEQAITHSNARDRALRSFEAAVQRETARQSRMVSRPEPRASRASTAASERSEFERFKRDINLIEFATSKGYRVDPRESSVCSKVLRHESSNDKIIAGRAPDGCWRYFSAHDRGDNGSIIDFVQRRENKDLGTIRLELREWTHATRDVAIPARHRDVVPVSKDRVAVALAVAQAQIVRHHPYLVGDRALSVETLNDERFRGTWKQAVGFQRNVLFLHHDEQGLCGFEVKNRGFTGFAKGGEKGLWRSNPRVGDKRLVITESAIDALSYHQLHRSSDTRYASVGGEQNPRQPELLERAIANMSAGSTIVAATDNDKAGHALAVHIRELCAKHPPRDVRAPLSRARQGLERAAAARHWTALGWTKRQVAGARPLTRRETPWTERTGILFRLGKSSVTPLSSAGAGTPSCRWFCWAGAPWRAAPPRRRP